MARTDIRKRDLPDTTSDDAGVRSTELDQLCINTIRTLAMDAVQKANSGHPGTPMALAPVAYTLWQEALRYDCDDPKWPNRDRFVLSNGHASMLLYALLHLAQVRDPEEAGRPAVSLDDIKQFRQLGSRCPGHPEYGVTPGVEDHDRPARARLRQQRRHGDRRTLSGEPLQSAGFLRHSISTSTLSAATAT